MLVTRNRTDHSEKQKGPYSTAYVPHPNAAARPTPSGSPAVVGLSITVGALGPPLPARLDPRSRSAAGSLGGFHEFPEFFPQPAAQFPALY